MHEYVPPQHPSAQFSTVHNWLNALCRRDFDAFGKLITDDYKHSVLPGSKGPVASNKEEGIAFAEKAMKPFKSVEFEIYAVNEAPGSIWIHLMLHAVSNDDKPFSSEYIHLFTLEEGPSPKICVMDEFVDTKKLADLFE